MFPNKYPFTNKYGYVVTKKSLDHLISMAKGLCYNSFRRKNVNFYGLEIALSVLKFMEEYNPNKNIKEITFLYWKLKGNLSHSYRKDKKQFEIALMVSQEDIIYDTWLYRNDLQQQELKIFKESKQQPLFSQSHDLKTNEVLEFLREGLKTKEIQILKLYSQGYSLKEILNKTNLKSKVSIFNAIKKAGQVWKQG